MGLDMFLSKVKKVDEYSLDDLVRINRNIPWNMEEPMDEEAQVLFDKGVINIRGEHFKHRTIFEELAYWRKANQIHNWFVENIQNGVDDCDVYEVSRKQIVDLLNTCQKVLDASKLVNGKVYAGSTITKEGEMVENYKSGKVIKDSSVAKSLLPTASGFFFGDTEYNEYYYSDICHTIDVLTKVLKDVDFEEYYVTYQSSW